ncbi:MAG TPA: hypothetical protein VI432_00980 [Candidatus Paceibacterota bacterium]
MYKELVTITREYLGPAADRFVERQVKSHLENKAEDVLSQKDDLNKEDIENLSNWFKVSISMMTDDRKTVDDFIRKINELNNKNGSR